jgi:hypothetical protein
MWLNDFRLRLAGLNVHIIHHAIGNSRIGKANILTTFSLLPYRKRIMLEYP